MRLYFICPLFLQKLIWIPTRFILWFFGRMEVRGLENLNGIKTPVIFAPNHLSELDPLLVPASLPFWSRFSPLFYTTREKLFYNTVGWRRHFFGGLFIKLWGGYPVSVGLRDYEKAMPHHIRLAKAGVSFCFFPEGGLTLDGTIQPAKGGVAHLAEFANYSIVPVGISGAFKMSATDFFFRRRKLVVHFGSAISQDDLRSVCVNANGNIYKQRGEYVIERVKQLVLAAQRPAQ